MSTWQKTTGILGVLLVAALVAIVVLVVSGDGGRSADAGPSTVISGSSLIDAQNQANEAAKAAAVLLTTYDYQSLDQDFGWAKDRGTEKFQQYYAEVSAPIREFVAKSRTHAEGSVVDSAARATDPDHATVLLFVDQTLTSQTSTERTLDQPRMTMLMVREGGRWLLDQVKISNLTSS